MRPSSMVSDSVIELVANPKRAAALAERERAARRGAPGWLGIQPRYDALSSEATLGVELGADRPDGSVWVRRVDDGGAWAAAGGAAGDLCCTIDGISASQALAELASGTRPRLAGASIAVEIERLGERRIIYPCWREIPDAIKPPVVIDAITKAEPPRFDLAGDEERRRNRPATCAVEWKPGEEPPDYLPRRRNWPASCAVAWDPFKEPPD
jgi:hypothetical protein